MTEVLVINIEEIAFAIASPDIYPSTSPAKTTLHHPWTGTAQDTLLAEMAEAGEAQPQLTLEHINSRIARLHHLFEFLAYIPLHSEPVQPGTRLYYSVEDLATTWAYLEDLSVKDNPNDAVLIESTFIPIWQRQWPQRGDISYRHVMASASRIPLGMMPASREQALNQLSALRPADAYSEYFDDTGIVTQFIIQNPSAELKTLSAIADLRNVLGWLPHATMVTTLRQLLQKLEGLRTSSTSLNQYYNTLN